jgi:ABC-type oligopeptide transport system substrate-binding subunit
MKTKFLVIKSIISNEITRLSKNPNYWGTKENVDNENQIVNYLLTHNIVNQEWFDERLKYTSTEMLEDVLKEIYLNYLDNNDEDEEVRDEYIKYFKL